MKYLFFIDFFHTVDSSAMDANDQSSTFTIRMEWAVNSINIRTVGSLTMTASSTPYRFRPPPPTSPELSPIRRLTELDVLAERMAQLNLNA